MSKDSIATRLSNSTHTATTEFQKPVTGTDMTGNKRALDVNVMSTSGSPLSDVNWDALDVQQTSGAVETYVFKAGGIAGTTVATCTVTYTSAARDILLNVVWT